MSWNATGIMTGLPYLCNELVRSNITICGLAEHWLLNHNANSLQNINPNYSAHTVTCSNPSYFNGRLIGKGGVALLWHRSVNSFVDIVEVDTDRIAAIQLTL